MATKKRPSAVSVLEMASQIEQKKCLSWYDKLPQADKKWCQDLKEEYLSGKYRNVTMESLCKIVNESLGISVTGDAFRVWMRKNSSK